MREGTRSVAAHGWREAFLRERLWQQQRCASESPGVQGRGVGCRGPVLGLGSRIILITVLITALKALLEPLLKPQKAQLPWVEPRNVNRKNRCDLGAGRDPSRTGSRCAYIKRHCPGPARGLPAPAVRLGLCLRAGSGVCYALLFYSGLYLSSKLKFWW